MPELPDLQVISKNLSKTFSGEKLLKVTIHKTKKVTTPSEVLNNALGGCKVVSIDRDGKELIIKLDNGEKLALHLMREGQLSTTKDEKGKHKIVELEFENDKYLVMSDFMKQATVVLGPESSSVPDALSDDFTLDYLVSRLTKKKSSTIKPFLVDQSNVKGIGNAYADEILWAAGISPKSKCGKITDDAVKTLHAKIGDVLHYAEQKIRERDPNLISGEIRDFLNVHTKTSTHSPTGAEIIKEKISGKSTYYTSEQKLYQ